MDNELSQLDALIESDVLDALGKNSETTLEDKDVEDIIDSTDTNNSTDINDSDEIIIEDFLEDENNDDITVEEDKEENDNNHNEEDISLDNENMLTEEPLLNASLETPITVEENLTGTNLAKLLSELLNNKTIEITIKIKE